MKRATITILAMLLVSVTVSGAGPEKWWEAYDRGVAAIRDANHAAAAQALQAAIAEMPKENGMARGRKEVFVYVPHFWLGIAKFSLGDVDGSLREFNISEDQGVVQNTRYYADLRDWKSRAEAQKQKSSDSVALRGKREASAAVKTAVSAQMGAVTAGAERSESYRAGLRKLQEAQAVSAQAGPNLSEYRRAADIAAQARAMFVAAAEEQQKQKAIRSQPVAQPPVQTAAAQPVTTPAAAPQTPTALQPAPVVEKSLEVAAPVQAPPAVSAAVAEARIAVQQYRQQLVRAASDNRRDPRFREWSREAMSEADKWQKALDAAMTSEAARTIASKVEARERDLGLRAADLARAATAAKALSSGEVRAVLERAWRAYAAGDLDRADELLTGVLASTTSAEAYLLRGCNRYAKAMLSKKPETTLGVAEADFRAALKLNGALRLDRKDFSPKLVAYFKTIHRK